MSEQLPQPPTFEDLQQEYGVVEPGPPEQVGPIGEPSPEE